jgi:pyruvate/2-oxoglutarate/acetoin dehydrogenase E1 component
MSTATRSTVPREPAETAGRSASYRKAFNEALVQEMRASPDVFVLGEDVAGYGGVFHLFSGLLDEFGDRRVIDTPISESAIVGLGVGAAACGLRPVVDIMFMDFLAVCLDQLVNQAAKMRYMFGGSIRVPLTIITAYGAGVSGGAQHSQSLEAWLAHVPGLKVVMPSNAYDVKGLTVAAIRDDNPVVVMLHKTLLGDKAAVPMELYEVPIGRAATVRSGSDVSIFATGRMVGEALNAAEQLQTRGISAEVVDLRTVQPLDTAAILESVTRTHHAVVVHEAVQFAGLGAEVAALIQSEAFDDLDAPVLRVAAPFNPVPFSPVLEKAYIPNAADIVAGVRGMLVEGR